MDILRKMMIVVFGGVMTFMLLSACSSVGNLFYRRQPLHDKEPYMSSSNDVKRFFEKIPLRWSPVYVADSANRLDIRGFFTRSQLDIYPDTCIVFYPDGFIKFFDTWGIYKVDGDSIKANINFYQTTDLLTLYDKGIGIATFGIEDSTRIVWTSLKLLPEYSFRTRFNNFTSSSAPRLKDTVDIDISKQCSNVFRLIPSDSLPQFYSYPGGSTIRRVQKDLFDR